MRNKFAHLRARKLGTLHGKNVFEFPVTITQDWLDRDIQEAGAVVRVIAHDAREAAQLVWDEVAHHVVRPTKVEVLGVKGGVAARRFIGYDSMVFATFLAARPDRNQLKLNLN